ncbi:MAG TPA: coenzyme F420-0:L-glutamate ligase [Patescibacteria group bacterium]|nr:coenzyme F420-0:L-glutamate ligase [Patescibacteria group bacterium]
MLITPIHTKKVILGDNLEDILKTSLPSLEENSVVVITSKIVSITQGNVVKIDDGKDKETLVKQEADKYIYDEYMYSTHKTYLTITKNILTPSAGIDESNGNGYYILWPKDPMKTAEKLWRFLQKTYHIKKVGVIISDSSFIPLRTGSVSIGLAWCGFAPIKNYIGTPDVFGKPLQYTTTSFVDGLSVAAGLAMGEGDQQQPIAVITYVPDLTFVAKPPTKDEQDAMRYPLEKDMFGPLIRAASWEKGKK